MIIPYCRFKVRKYKTYVWTSYCLLPSWPEYTDPTVSYLRDTDGDNEDEDEDLPPFNSEEIENLEKVQVTQEMLVRIPKCLICLEAFNKDEEVISLLCEHFYHCNCINNWLKIRPTCPMCRGNPRERE